jgi:peroxiredoxin Q/BCP
MRALFIAVAALALLAAGVAVASFAAGGPDASQLLPVGSAAPQFVATAHTGETVDLATLRGRHVVLFFYPKDDTSGCTKEACELRDSWAKLQSSGVAVFGVSTQDNRSHRAFAQKYQLPFPLIPDEKGELAAKYKVPIIFGVARRITYLIDGQGRIKHVWPAVKPAGHAREILAAIDPVP